MVELLYWSSKGSCFGTTGSVIAASGSAAIDPIPMQDPWPDGQAYGPFRELNKTGARLRVVTTV